MRKTEWVWKLLMLPALSLSFMCFIACDKTDYDLLDPSAAGVWTLYNKAKSNLPANEISDIKVDKQGNLWVGFSYNGAGVLSKGKWTFYTTSDGLIRNSVKALEVCSNGNIIFGTSNGLSTRTSTGQWTSFKDPNVTTMYINDIRQLSDGSIWFGTDGQGFYEFDGTSYYQYLFEGLENVYVVETDRFGNLWMGTDNGLISRIGTEWSVWTTESGLLYNQVTALYFDNQDRMWIGYGTENVYEVSYYDYKKDLLSSVYLYTGLSGVEVHDIQQDRNGNYWFALWWDGLIEYDGVKADSYKKYNGFCDDFNAIEQDNDGNLWFGTYESGLYKYTLPLGKH